MLGRSSARRRDRCPLGTGARQTASTTPHWRVLSREAEQRQPPQRREGQKGAAGRAKARTCCGRAGAVSPWCAPDLWEGGR